MQRNASGYYLFFGRVKQPNPGATGQGKIYSTRCFPLEDQTDYTVHVTSTLYQTVKRQDIRYPMPSPYLPAGLRLDRQEGAGEVQTPLLGPAARGLSVGDRVYFRHAKAGELCERFLTLHLLAGDRIVDQVPTYRGEGRCFL